MARTPTATHNPPTLVATTGLNPLVEDQQQLDAVTAQYNEDRDLMNQLWGQIQMADAISKLTTVVSLQKLAHIKETRLYRALRGKRTMDSDGVEIPDVGTWDGFCRSIGTSANKVDEDLKNLSVFGEEALARLTSIGAGYRELRKLRKLPEDERLLISNAQDRESLIGLIDDMAVKHASEKAALEKAAADAQADYQAQATVSQNKQKRIEELERETARIHHLRPDENLEEMRQALLTQAGVVEVDIRALRQGLVAITEFYEANPGSSKPLLAGLLANIELALIGLKNEFGIEDAPTADPRPEWVRLQEAGQLN